MPGYASYAHTSLSHRSHIALTSPSHRPHIAITSPTHRPHIPPKYILENGSSRDISEVYFDLGLGKIIFVVPFV